jgi:hypothetical protein
VRFPRKACRNGDNFARAMRSKPTEIIKAMDVLDDAFVKDFEKPQAGARAEAELDFVDAIENAGAAAEEKGEELFKLLEGDLPETASAGLFE